eukprot:COSAG02_NODE_13632_length_1369_cov_1.637795_3_plen_125_part_00
MRAWYRMALHAQPCTEHARGALPEGNPVPTQAVASIAQARRAAQRGATRARRGWRTCYELCGCVVMRSAWSLPARRNPDRSQQQLSIRRNSVENFDFFSGKSTSTTIISGKSSSTTIMHGPNEQ